MDERRRWEHLGEVLHCIQDAFSPAHVDRDGARIVRMKHWGPFDRLRTRSSGLDEHGFPTDSRDHALLDGALTKEARQAATVTRDYLELVRRQLEDTDPGSAPRRAELKTFLDRWVTGPLS
jgi:hypothetical protein